MIHKSDVLVQVWDNQDNCFRKRTVRLTIDTQKLAQQMARNVFRNKSKKAKVVSGAVVCEA